MSFMEQPEEILVLLLLLYQREVLAWGMTM